MGNSTRPQAIFCLSKKPLGWRGCHNNMKKSVKDKKLSGIDGWLLLPTIAFFIKAFIFLTVAIVALFYIIIVSSKINYILAFLTIALLAFFSIYSLILEFKNKKLFITLTIIFIWLEILITLIWFMTENISYSGLAYYSITSIILTTYLSLSKRVKNTFVK